MSLSLRHLVHLGPPLNPNHPPPRRGAAAPLISPDTLRHPHLLAKAASISGSSAADYPEQPIIGGAPPERRRGVAGVDQEGLLDPEVLADPDSSFYELNGVRLHHKIRHHASHAEQEASAAAPGLPIILLHGFGASLFSWNRVMGPLARLAGSKVLAFDRPAFGLTSRASLGNDPTPLNPYSMAFSVLATVSFIEMLTTGKAIVMGHSAGCLVAVDAYFEAPERVAALILVAPAIVAPFVSRGSDKGGGKGKEEEMEDERSGLDAVENPFVRIWRGVCEFFVRIAGAVSRIVKGMRDMIGSVYVRALSAVLRSAFAVMLVRMVMDKFGIAAIRNSWYDANQITDHVIEGYTKPLKSKGWEKALLEYTLAMLTESQSKSMPPLARRLAEISCPVLIITGDTDRLVPSWNAKRLSEAIPGSTFEVIKNCGHLPHEERVDEFLSVVERFLQKVFGAPEGQFTYATP